MARNDSHSVDKHKTIMQRLKDIEQHVIDAVEMAAAVMEELGNLGPGLNPARVTQLCNDFGKKILDAQQLVQEGIEATTVERDFKATVYAAMHKAHIGHEKVSSVSMQLRNMLRVCTSELERRRCLDEKQGPEAADVDMQDDAIAARLGEGLHQQELGLLQRQSVPADDPGMEWEDL